MKSIIRAFVITALIYMILGVLVGGAISGGSLGDYAKTDEGHWLEAEHAFINFIGFLSFGIMALFYAIMPISFGRKLKSTRLATTTLVLLNLGIFLMIVFTAVKGLGIDTVISPKLVMTGGILLTVGYVTFGIDILKLVKK
jgi:cbb3-type cytochrome oxidase subunit 1